MASIYGSEAHEKVKLCELNLRRCTLHCGRNPANLLFLAFSKQRKTVSKQKGSKGFAHQSFDHKTALIIISISRPPKFHWKMSWRFKNYGRPNPSKMFLLEKCSQFWKWLPCRFQFPHTYSFMCRFFFQATNNNGNIEHAKNQILEQRNKSKLIFFLFEFWGENVVFCNKKVDVCFVFFSSLHFSRVCSLRLQNNSCNFKWNMYWKSYFYLSIADFFLEQFSYI